MSEGSAESRSLVGLLGMTPVLAVAVDVQSGLLVGVLFAGLLVASVAAYQGLRPWLTEALLLPGALVVVGTFVAVADVLLQAFAVSARNALGIYLPLFAWNALVLDLMLGEARAAPVTTALRTALLVLGFALLLGAIRALLAGPAGIRIADSPVGGLLAAAVIFAAYQAFRTE